jgi:hypothetical protein
VSRIERTAAPSSSSGGGVTKAEVEATIAEKAPLEWREVEELTANLKAEGGAFSSKMLCALGADGQIHLAGNLEASVEIAAKTTLFKLPTAMHPAKERAVVLALVTFMISAAGAVSTTGTIAAKQKIHLDSVSFPKTATGE